MRNDEVVAIISLCMHNIALDYYHLLHKRRIRQINVSRRQANRPVCRQISTPTNYGQIATNLRRRHRLPELFIELFHF